MTLVVAPCSAKAARYAVERWHYSHCMPAPPSVFYGAWESGRYVGVVIFGRGATGNLLKPYGLDAIEGAELTRVAFRDHSRAVSQIVALAVRQLRRSSPGLRLLVSFADPAQGHHGGIYQAMGWLYAGTTNPSKGYRDSAGRVLHERVVSPSGWKRQYGAYKRVPRPCDLEPITLPGKHRYLLPLDRKMRKRIESLARPYPKARGRSVESDAPAALAGGAGATPVDRSNRSHVEHH